MGRRGGAGSLSEVVQFLRGDIALVPMRSVNGWSDVGSAEQELDFGEVKGQQHVKRAKSLRPVGIYPHLWTYSARSVRTDQ
jgi:predicted ATPase with chaperone activity